jgi:outer membrane protein TolC
MKTKSALKKLPAIILVLSIVFSVSVSALETDQIKNISLEYRDIEKYVLEGNLQLKLSNASISKLNHDIDETEEDAEDAQDALYGLVYGINGVMDSLHAVIDKTENDPDAADLYTIANATYLSLSVTQKNIYSQIESMEDSTDGMEDQVDLAELNYEQAEDTLVNTAQNLYILYHQLSDNLGQMDINRAQLTEQLELIRKNIELGLSTELDLTDLETSMLELDASCNALVHQKEALLLQMKGLLGLTYKDSLSIGEVPAADRSFADTIDFNKDLEEAIKNAMSIKIKEAELNNSSIYGSRRTYELKIKENEAVLSFTKKYYTLLESGDNLLVSESKLKAAELKLKQGQISFDKGMLSQTALNSLKDEAETLKLKVKSDSASLFSETENYKAMKAGML